MIGIAAIACVALALSASCARGLARRHRRLSARPLASLRPGARHLAAQVGTLSDFRLPLMVPPVRQQWRRIGTLLASR
jgi:hypothetical protein